MKQLFHSIVHCASCIVHQSKTLTLLLTLLLSVNMWGADVKFNASGTDWSGTAGEQSKTKDKVTIATNNGLGDSEYRVYKNATFTVSSTEGNITKIEFTCTANNTAKYGPGCFANLDGYSYNGKVGTWTGSQASVTFTASSNQVRMTEIVVTYTDSKTLSSIAVKTAPTKTTYIEGDHFDPTGLEITKKYSDNSTEDLAYAGHTSDFTFSPTTSTALTTSNTSVTITVDGKTCTQQITVNAKVAATITLMEAGTSVSGPTGKYSGDEYELPKTVTHDCGDKTFVGWSTETVDSPTKPTSKFYEPGEEVTLAANNTFYAVFADASEGGTSNETLTCSAGTIANNTMTFNTTNFTFVHAKESSSFFGSYSPWRMYQNTSLTISGDYTITKVEMVTNTTNYGGWTTTAGDVTVATTSGGTSKVENINASSVKFTFTSQARWSSIKVYYDATTYSNYTTTCAEPRDIDHIEVTGTSATFWKGDEFNHTGMTVKAYYTEGDPDDVTSKAEFSTPDMTTAGVKTVTVTYKDETATYTIDVKTIANTAETAYTTTKAIELIDANKDLATKIYVQGKVSKVNGYYSSKYITYFLDEDAFEIYNGLGKNGVAFSSQDDIQVNDEVVVYGQLTKHNSIYEFAADNQLVSLTRPKKLKSITVTGTPDYFDTQSSFNHNGMTVTAHYNTGASDDADVTEKAEFTAPDMTTQGEKTVNVSYTEEGITKEASYKIQVAQYCANVVTITKGDEENGTFTLSQTGNICADGGLTISVTDIVPAEHYHFKEITATNGIVDNTNKQVTDIDANSTIAVVFEEDTKYELKWMVSGEQMGTTAMLYEGDDVTAPTGTVTVPEACANEGKVFVGWTAQKDYEHATDAPTFFAPHKMGAANETYYAVFANAEAGGTEDALMITLNMSDPSWGFPTDYEFGPTQYTNAQGYAIEIMGTSTNSGKGYKAMTDEDGNPKALIMGKTNAYLLLPQFDFAVSKIVCEHNDGQVSGSVTWNVYAGDNAASTSITGCANDAEFVINQAYQNSQLKIKVTNGNNTQFKNIQIYSKISYSDYVTSCVVPTYSVTIQSNNTTMGSVTVEPEITEDAYEAGTEFIVEATAEEGYRFVNWTISDNNEGASLSEEATEAVNIFTTGAASVTLTANFEAIPADPITVTLEVGEHGTLDCEDCEGNELTEEIAGEGVLVPNVNATTGWAFLGWSTSSTATVAEYNPADADIFLPSDDNKTLYAVYAQLYKVTLKYTDEVKWQTTAGGAITLPSRDCNNETYKGHFAGWSITEFATEATNPAETPTIYPVGDFVPTADITLYPVFSVSTMGGTKWVKKTGDQVTESGVYAILCSSEKAFNGTKNSGHGQVTETAFSFDANGVATSAPTGTCEVTLTAVTGGFKMYNSSIGYIYATKAGSGGLSWHDSDDSYWYWNSRTNNWTYNSNNARLRSASGSSIRTYDANNGDAAVHFAKKESVEENKYWSKPANDVTNPELDLAAGDYLVPQTVKITAASYDVNLIYYYTTDGTTPAAIDLEPQGNTQEYEPSTGIVLATTGTTTVKLIGYDEDGYTSQIASAEYHIYPIFTSISDMYTNAVADKPVGLVLTNAYVHAVNTIGQNSQIFVQQGNLGVVLSTTTVPDGVVAGKQISGTATGTYKITNGRPQISSFAFQSTFSVGEGTRPEPTTITETTADLVSTHLLGLVKLEGVYAQSDASNIIVVNSNADGTGTSMNVYDFFNKVSTIPASDIKCNVIGLFNERQNNSDPIVYSIMPILTTDFDVVEKQNATLPTVSPLGSTVEAEPTKVASGETVTITPVAGFTTSYKVNDAAEWTTSPLSFNISETNTKLEIKATRPYYNDASATYYYEIDPGLTKYHITLPFVQTYYKIVSDVTDQKAGETVTLTISNITEHWNITGVTVENADDETTTVEVANPETNIYTFVMPAYAVNVKVSYKSDPTYSIDYLRGITGSTGDDITESKQYAGVELALKECTWKAAGYTFKNWYAYYLDDESQEVAITITDNKIIVPAHDVKIKAMWDEAAWHKDGTWELVTKESDIVADAYYIMAENVAGNVASYEFSGNSGKQYMQKLTVSNWTDKTVLAKSQIPEKTAILMLSGTTGNWIFTCDNNQKQMTIANTSDAGLSWTDAGTPLNIAKKENSENNEMKIYVMHDQTEFHMLVNSQGGYKPYSSSAMAWPQLYRFYPKARKVFFYANAGDDEVTNMPEMQRADPTTNKVTIPNVTPKRTGYTFTEWNSNAQGGGVHSAQPNETIELWQAECTLHAIWTKNTPLLTVANVEHGTIQAKPNSMADIYENGSANVEYQKSVVISHTDDDEEYAFKTWKITKTGDESVVITPTVGKTSVTFNMPDYPVTISAIYESKTTIEYTLMYDANGGEGTMTGNPFTQHWNDYITVSDNKDGDNDIFTKTLCEFNGWNTKADGTGASYAAGAHFYMKSDVTLYAQWKGSGATYYLDKLAEGNIRVKEGAAPQGSTATYNNTNPSSSVDQATQGNTITITLTGYAGKVIKNITANIKANGTESGKLNITIGDKNVFDKTYVDLEADDISIYQTRNFGGYGFKPIFVGEEENIVIVVTSPTHKSAYIQNITVEYETPQTTTIRGNLTPDQYTTYCEPQTVFAGTYTGATFWNIADRAYMSDGVRLASITIEQYFGDLEAGVPYIMLPEATELTGVKYGEAIANPVEEGNNGLYGTFVNYAFDENEATARDAQQLYVISNGTLYLCGTGCGVYAYHAYIKSDQINYVAPSGAPRRTIGGKGTGPATGWMDFIDGIAEKVQKLIINEQLVIIRDGRMYNAQGKFLK